MIYIYMCVCIYIYESKDGNLSISFLCVSSVSLLFFFSISSLLSPLPHSANYNTFGNKLIAFHGITYLLLG